jgi:glycerol-3-phosphate dehydrogenase
MIFVIPWRDFSLVGTTDTDFEGDLDRVHATRDEVAYLLEEVRRVLPSARVRPSEVAYTYAGVRPLTLADGARASDVSREHAIVAEEGERILSITGTKLTCFRSLAEEVGDRVMLALEREALSRTAHLTLDGADDDVDVVEGHTWLDVSQEASTSGLGRQTLETLVGLYGRGYAGVVTLAGKVPEGTERLCPSNPDVVAQLYLAVQDEMAVSLQDVLLRRTGIGTSPCQGQDCAEAIGRRMAGLLGWSPRRLAAELDAYQAHVARSHRFKA